MTVASWQHELRQEFLSQSKVSEEDRLLLQLKAAQVPIHMASDK